MHTKNAYLISAITGAVLGLITAYSPIKLSWLCLVPWGLGGLILGYFSADKRQSLVNGAVYGFFLSLAFLILGFSGTSLAKALTGLILLSLFGSAGGLVSSLIGRLLGKN